LDLAGHGESGLGRKAWTIAAFGGDAAAVVEELGLERVILIGHSMGGDVVVEAARRLRGRVAGLVWVDTYRQLGDPRPEAAIEEFAQPFRTNFVERTRSFVRGMFPETADPALVERVANDMSSAPPDVAVEALVHAFSFDREIPPALKELNLPVVAINAETSGGDPESLKRHGVEVLLMSGVGHFLMLEDPARFNTLLRRAIDTFAP
jgi:pimeloyl-ACP methyl ester carboxylesterase